MKMALPKDIPTLEAMAMKNLTRVDNVFCSEDLLDHFISCNMDPQQRPQKTDHMPVISVIDISPVTSVHKPRLNYRLTDWTEFNKTLKSKLDAILDPIEIATTDDFQQMFEVLDKVIQETIKEHVPMSKPCPYSMS
jgi:hypothetical protein